MSHKYEQDAAGNLVHYIQDEPRAWIAAANVEAYRAIYPDAPSVPAVAPAPTEPAAPIEPAAPAAPEPAVQG